MSNAGEKTVTREKIDIGPPPPDYKVIYMNDDVTTYDFVIESLVMIFDYEETQAANKAEEIDNHGSGVVAVLPFEIAEQKGTEVLQRAREQNFPLEIRLEEND